MNSFTVTYTIKYKIAFATEYVFNQFNDCYNLKTGRKIKKVYNNGCLGYSIKGNFYSLVKLRPYLIKPKKEQLPF